MLVKLNLGQMLDIFSNEVSKTNIVTKNYIDYSFLGSSLFDLSLSYDDKDTMENPTITLNDLFEEWKTNDRTSKSMDDIYDKENEYTKNILKDLILSSVYHTCDIDKVNSLSNEEYENCLFSVPDTFSHLRPINLIGDCMVLKEFFNIDFNLPKNRDRFYRKYSILRKEDTLDPPYHFSVRAFNNSPHKVTYNVSSKYNDCLIILLLSFYVDKNFINDIKFDFKYVNNNSYDEIEKNIKYLLDYRLDNKNEIKKFQNYLNNLEKELKCAEFEIVKSISSIIDSCLLEKDI